MENKYSIINFFDKFKLKYSDYIRPEIVSTSMIQTQDEVYLETVELQITDDGLNKHTINRLDLDFIADWDEKQEEEIPFFDSNDDIEVNLKKFIDDFTPYSIINTTDLFTNEAANKISAKYNRFGIDK